MPKKRKSKAVVESDRDDPVRIFVRFRPLADSQVASDRIHLLGPQTIAVDGDAAAPAEDTPRALPQGRRLLTGGSAAESPQSARRLITSPVQILGSDTPRRRSVHGGQFRFSQVLDGPTRAAEVYQQTAAPMIGPLFSGYNCTIMAYGQSGSGKTATMMGYHKQSGNAEDRGIIPRVIEEIFSEAQTRSAADWSITVRIANVQIYMERVLDLLDPANADADPENAPSLTIRQRPNPDGTEEIYVDGVTWKNVTSVETCVRWIEEGNRHRVVASTDLNSVSSRSHSVFMIQIEQVNLSTREHLLSQFNLVDLAGSETVRRTGAQGLTLAQAGSVNKSLSTLGNVISALAAKHQHVPYRDSKLTRLLTHALGGNSHTVIILTCSSATMDVTETLSTLQFGKRALDMPNKPKINKVMTMEDFKRLLEQADETMARQKMIIESLEKDNASLQQQLAGMAPQAATAAAPVSATLDDVSDTASSTVAEEDETKVAEDNHTLRHIGHLRRSLGYLEPHEAAELKQLAAADVPAEAPPVVSPVVAPPPAAPAVIDMPQIETPPPAAAAVHIVDSDQDDSDDDELLLPPIVPRQKTPAARYFTPRTMAVLNSDLVAGIQREKDELQRRLADQADELRDLRAQLDAVDTAAASRELNLAQDAPAPAQPEPAEPKNAEEPRKEEEQRADAEPAAEPDADANVMLLAVGASVFAILLAVALLLRFYWKLDIHPAFWGVWSGAAASTAVLGWGLPRV